MKRTGTLFVSVTLFALIGGLTSPQMNAQTVNGQAEFLASGTFTVPSKVTRIRAFVYGAGGGAGGSLVNQPGFNGGSGAFGEAVITVKGGQTLTITVGVGGTGGAPFNAVAGTAGGATNILDQNKNALLSAGGGGGGDCGACFPFSVGSGGAVGVGPVGSIMHSGPDGSQCGGGQTRCGYTPTGLTAAVSVGGRGFNNGDPSETTTIDGIGGYVYLEW